VRLGLIVPSSNTVAEPDFIHGVPASISVHTARMRLETTTAAAERAMLDGPARRAAVELGTCRPDLVVFSCTSAAALLGDEGELELERELEQLAGAPVVSTNRAVAQALARTGARRIAVATPYVAELNAAIAARLEDRGFEVAAVCGMGIDDNFAIAEVEPSAIVDFVRAGLEGADFEALFVSCTNLRAADAYADLHAAVGVPVVTSNLAALSSVTERVRGAGMSS
jgi:maleate isomerase